MKSSYIALGIGVTALIAAVILAFFLTREPEAAAPPPPAAISMSEDRLNRLEAEMNKLQEENTKLHEENSALRKESELLGKTLSTPATPGADDTNPAAPAVAQDGTSPAPVVPASPFDEPTGKPAADPALSAANSEPLSLPGATSRPAPEAAPSPKTPGPDPTLDFYRTEAALNGDQKAVLQLPMIGRVLEYEKDYGVIAFDAGKLSNISAGTMWSIRRDTFLVCSVKVKQVRDNDSIAEIVPGTMPLGMQVKVGDEVVAFIASDISVEGRMGVSREATPRSTPGARPRTAPGSRSLPTPSEPAPLPGSLTPAPSDAPSVPAAPAAPRPIGPAPAVTSEIPGAPPPAPAMTPSGR